MTYIIREAFHSPEISVHYLTITYSIQMKKLLVIEDNNEIRDNICELLELADYEVYDAADGKEGIEKASVIHPDLILCDVMMPKVDGYGVLKILREREATSRTPFIFLTAKGDRQDFRKGMTLGADDYIPKPFDDTELLETIRIRLQKSQDIRRPKSTMIKSKESIDKIFEQKTAQYETRRYYAKEYIYKASSKPHWLYVVVSGIVKLCKANEFGKEIITKIIRPGESFGYHAILDNHFYEENAIALGDSEVRLIPAQDFVMMIHNDQDLSNYFVTEIIKNAKECQDQLLELAYSSVRKKVANALLRYAGGEDQSNIKVSRDDLAALAGTAKETLVRTLKDFKNEGLIAIENSIIDILDDRRLREMSN